MIYLDNAATTIQKPPSVTDAIMKVLTSDVGNPGRGASGPSLNGLRLLTRWRHAMNKTFCDGTADAVIFAPGVTWALNLMLKGLLKSSDHILTTPLEHNSVLRPLYQLEEAGATLSELPLEGDALRFDENLLRENTRALVITAASNVTGAVTNLKEASDFCEKHDLLLIVDGAQSLGCIPQDLGSLPRFLYCFTGHKGLHGPTGSGGVFVKGKYPFSPVFSGGSGYNSFSHTQPLDLPGLFEPGTVNLLGVAGLMGALELSFDEEHFAHMARLRRLLVDGLSAIPNLEIVGPKEEGAPLVSLRSTKKDPEEMARILWEDYAIASRAGSHCAPRVHELLSTEGLLRLSLSRYTTEEEIHTALEALEAILA